MLTLVQKPPLWQYSQELVAYDTAVAEMESYAEDIRAKGLPDKIWLLEHPPLYTAGTSAKTQDLLDAKFPVFETGRGGQYTYHGPGQRVCYVMMDLKNRDQDVRKYVHDLEEWIIRTLDLCCVTSFRREGRVGIWVNTSKTEAKIAAIGVRVKKWVTLHGISINVNPDLSHFSGIVPCGLAQFGVTSLQELGVKISMDQLDAHLKKAFADVFSI